jgi:3-methylfumaryl-CoA hydratase
VSAEIQIADDYAAWVGRSKTATDVVSPQPARLLAATLDLENTEFSERDPLPPLWHWLYHLPAIRTSELGVDGHPRRGGFLPPIKLPRRMFAGGRLQFHRPICIGDIVHRTRMIGAVERKEGRGPAHFISLRYATRSVSATDRGRSRSKRSRTSSIWAVGRSRLRRKVPRPTRRRPA